MKKLYNRHPVVFLGLLISLASGAVGLTFKASPADTFLITVSTASLALLVEVLLNTAALKQFNLFTRGQIDLMLDDERVAANVRATLNSYASARRVTDNPVFQRRFERMVTEQTEQLKGYASGRFTSSLRPDFFFREPDVLELFGDKMIATSMVDPREYWASEWGQQYLRDQAAAQKRIRARRGQDYEAVERIFIQERRRLGALVPVLQIHRTFGLKAYVAVLEEIPDELRRDFMVVDERLLLWLSFSPGTRTPVASTVVVRGTSAEHDIDHHVDVFKRLKAYARDPSDMPQIARSLDLAVRPESAH